MDGKICMQCNFHHRNRHGNIWCNLAHDFVENLGDFCPKEKTVEEIKESCDNYVPPEKMSDGESLCLAHLVEARTPHCWIEKIKDLLNDPDFELKKEV